MKDYMKNHKTGLTKKKTSWDDDINQYVTIETTTARYGGKFIRYDVILVIYALLYLMTVI